MGQKIKVNIAGRLYPLTVNENEEEFIRIASKKIEELVKNFESNFEVSDKQDVLAMCCLQFATKYENVLKQQKNEQDIVAERIQDLNELLQHAL